MGMLCTYVSLMYTGIFTGTVNQEAEIKTLGSNSSGHIPNESFVFNTKIISATNLMRKKNG